MRIALIILLALLLLYILFIVIPSVLIFNFAFGRKECSIPLSERGDLSGTRYEPYADELIAADTYVRSHPMERVGVTAEDGTRLSGFYLDQHSDRTMIFVHGYRGEPVSNFCMQAKHYCELGWNLLFIIQRAHGESGGKWLGLGVLECRDLPLWIDLAARREGVENIVLSGSSMGASTIAYASDVITEPKVKALVLDCGFISPRHQLMHDARMRHLPGFLTLPVMRAYGRLRIGADIYRRTTDSLKNCRVPAVFIHGTGDLTVSCEQGLENYNACASEKLWIPVEGAQHILACTVGGKDTEMKTERFLMQYIKPTPRKERKFT